jgi:hypothetical protein
MVAITALALGIAATTALRWRGHEAAVRHHAIPSVQHLDLPGPEAVGVATGAAPSPLVEPDSARDAFELFLSAEAEGRVDASFALTRPGDVAHGDWAEDHADRLVPTTFTVEDERALDAAVTELTVLVHHSPAVDAFVGFVPGTTRETWRVGADGSGHWRVQVPALSSQLVLPDDAGAAAVTTLWLAALGDCDPASAARLQVEPSLFGRADLARPLCDAGAWSARAATRVQRGADVEAFAAAFGPDLGDWARLVPVEGPGGGFFAVVVPLGDVWRVLGIASGLGR